MIQTVPYKRTICPPWSGKNRQGIEGEVLMNPQERQALPELPIAQEFVLVESWQSFQERVIPHLKKKNIMDLLGVLHEAVEIPIYQVHALDALDRITFYLHFAQGGGRALLQRRHKTESSAKPAVKIPALAYKLLLENRTLLPWFTTTFNINATSEEMRPTVAQIYLEIAEQIVDFFKQWENIPYESNHRAIVAKFLEEFYRLKANKFIETLDGLDKNLLRQLKKRLKKVRADIPEAMINCKFYNSIVELRMTETMPLLKKEMMKDGHILPQLYRIAKLLSIQDVAKTIRQTDLAESPTDKKMSKLVNTFLDLFFKENGSVQDSSRAWLKLWIYKIHRSNSSA